MLSALKKLDPLVHAILLLLILALFAIAVSQRGQIKDIYSRLDKQEVVIVGDKLDKPKTPSGKCSEDCRKTIAEIVSSAIATISAIPKTIVQNVSTPKTSYISLGTTGTTTSTAWVDAVGTDVWVDLAGDYSKDARVSFDISLSVTNGNGTAYARLFDVTHGIAVNGSEVSTNSAALTQASSGNLALWSGRNLYRIQLKSLNSFVVTYQGGRIKISY